MAIKQVRVKMNGVWTALTQNAAGKWEGTMTAPAVTSYHEPGGYYPLTIEAANEAGTVTTKFATDEQLGPSLRLVVQETIKPVVTLVSPSNHAYISNNQAPVVFQVTDEAGGSGVDLDSVQLQLAGKTYGRESDRIQTEAITNGYRITYTPSEAYADGIQELTITARDHDGNAAAPLTASYTVDTVPPSLTISAPADGLITNRKECIVQGVTNDALSSPVTVTVVHNGTAQGMTAVGEGGAFAQAVALTEGENTITVTAADAAGKETAITLTVLLDTTVPEITSVTMTPNPVNASAGVKITLEVH